MIEETKMTYYDLILKNKEEELEKAKEEVRDRARLLSERMTEVSKGDVVIYGIQDFEGRLVWMKNAVAEVENITKELKLMKEIKQAVGFNI